MVEASTIGKRDSKITNILLIPNFDFHWVGTKGVFSQEQVGGLQNRTKKDITVKSFHVYTLSLHINISFFTGHGTFSAFGNEQKMRSYQTLTLDISIRRILKNQDSQKSTVEKTTIS